MSEGKLSSSKAQKELRQRAEHERIQADADLKRLAELPEFRRFMWRLQSGFCGVFSDPSLVAGGIDGQRVTDQNIGAMRVGHRVRDELQRVNPIAWNRMLTEAMERSTVEQLSTPAEPEPEFDE